MKLKPSEPAKERRMKVKEKQAKEYSQQTIVGFVEALSDDELKNEYTALHPKKAAKGFPTKLVMKNAVIKSLGGRLKGKYQFMTEEE
jgi:hypothetical protein